jgi:hypothetical protein
MTWPAPQLEYGMRSPHISGMADKPDRAGLAPLGLIEPHTSLLQRPPIGQLLYKVMSVENCISSIERTYLHFNRVDQYKDFLTADRHDGEQLPADRPGNAAMRFENALDFSQENQCDVARSRTYACSFSLENSDYIWRTYGTGGSRGKISMVFDFDKLRASLNRAMQSSGAVLVYNDIPCRPFLSLNYGLVEYVDWERHRTNVSRPIVYAHLKDRARFADERELRVTLSAIGIGKFVLADLTEIKFPKHLHFAFDFKAAFADGTVQMLLRGPDCDSDYLDAELRRLGAETREG